MRSLYVVVDFTVLLMMLLIPKPTFKVWSKLGQLQLKYCLYWVFGGWWVVGGWTRIIFMSNSTIIMLGLFELMLWHFLHWNLVIETIILSTIKDANQAKLNLRISTMTRKNLNKVVVCGHRKPTHYPSAPLSQCSSVLMSQCPCVPVSQYSNFSLSQRPSAPVSHCTMGQMGGLGGIK